MLPDIGNAYFTLHKIEFSENLDVTAAYLFGTMIPSEDIDPGER